MPNTPAEPSVKSAHPSRRPFYLACLLGIIWLLLLALLSLFTANPPTVNRAQLLNSDAVVIGTYDPQTRQVIVEEVLAARPEIGQKNATVGSQFELSQFDGKEAKLNPGLFPITMNPAGDWEITMAPLEKNNRLVYPATASVLQTARDLFNRP